MVDPRKMTDRQRATRLVVLAERALRKNRARRFQMPWAEVVIDGLFDPAERAYATAAAPSVVLRLLRRLHRLEGWDQPLTKEAIDQGDYA